MAVKCNHSLMHNGAICEATLVVSKYEQVAGLTP